MAICALSVSDRTLSVTIRPLYASNPHCTDLRRDKALDHISQQNIPYPRQFVIMPHTRYGCIDLVLCHDRERSGPLLRLATKREWKVMSPSVTDNLRTNIP